MTTNMPTATKLSNRQQTIVEMAAHGASIQEIARKTLWSERTIKNELSSLCERLSARNTTHLVFIATKAGMIT